MAIIERIAERGVCQITVCNRFFVVDSRRSEVGFVRIQVADQSIIFRLFYGEPLVFFYFIVFCIIHNLFFVSQQFVVNVLLFTYKKC